MVCSETLVKIVINFFLEQLFNQGRGNRLPGIAGSLRAGFNGVTEWIDQFKSEFR